MKKILCIAFFSIFLSGCSYQNELLFKHYNQKGIEAFQAQKYDTAITDFQKAEPFRPDWSLVSQNNVLAAKYEQQDFSDLNAQYSEIISQKCDIEKQLPISPVCENIFYGEGNTLYRLGENDQNQAQVNYWNQSIDNYQKALQINPDNTWAQENIDFIQKKLQELAQKQKLQNSSSDDKQDKDSNQHIEPEEEDDSSAEAEQDSSTKGNDSDNNDKENNTGNDNSSNSDSQDKSAASEAEEKNEKEETDNEEDDTSTAKTDANSTQDTPVPSRLPTQIQNQLDEYQKNLENSESDNQKYFQRNPNAQQNQTNDPFDGLFQNDPFFQDFFSNDPFFNQQPNLKRSLPNPDEKDW